MIAEFAMNDGTQAACKGDGSGSVPARASFERLIRKLQVCGGGGLLLDMLRPALGSWPALGSRPALGPLAARRMLSPDTRAAPSAGATQQAGGDCDGRLQLCARRCGLLPQGGPGGGVGVSVGLLGCCGAVCGVVVVLLLALPAGLSNRERHTSCLVNHPPDAALPQNAENDMSIIAAYYGLPVLSVRAATFHQMLRNQHGYKVGGCAIAGV